MSNRTKFKQKSERPFIYSFILSTCYMLDTIRGNTEANRYGVQDYLSE
jgi:hypothetical protein